jgi:enoyl-[acyl-carrier protein] reductase II
LPLIPQVVSAVKIPVVAAGGIGDARGFVAALVLGACGVQMGTRFLATNESDARLEQKRKILNALEEDTVPNPIFTGRNVRVIRSPELDELIQKQRIGATPKKD